MSDTTTPAPLLIPDSLTPEEKERSKADLAGLAAREAQPADEAASVAALANVLVAAQPPTPSDPETTKGTRQFAAMMTTNLGVIATSFLMLWFNKISEAGAIDLIELGAYMVAAWCGVRAIEKISDLAAIVIARRNSNQAPK
jgi:hypothetical protein